MLIKCHERISPYSKPNQSVLLTNIELPNDGFLYMEEYCKGGKKTLRIEETSSSASEVSSIRSVSLPPFQYSRTAPDVSPSNSTGNGEQGKYNGDPLKNFVNQMASK